MSGNRRTECEFAPATCRLSFKGPFKGACLSGFDSAGRGDLTRVDAAVRPKQLNGTSRLICTMTTAQRKVNNLYRLSRRKGMTAESMKGFPQYWAHEFINFARLVNKSPLL
jgi:hypothetical protein